MEQQKNTASSPILMFLTIVGAILLAVLGVYLVRFSNNNKTEETKRDTTSTQTTAKTPSYEVALEETKDNINEKRRSMVAYDLTDRYFLENYWKYKAVVAAIISALMAFYPWKKFGRVSALSVFIIAFICCCINLSRLLERWGWVDLSLQQFQAKVATNQVKLLDSAKGQQSKNFLKELKKAKGSCATAYIALAKQGKKAAKKLKAYKKYQQFLQDTIHVMKTLIKKAEAKKQTTTQQQK